MAKRPLKATLPHRAGMPWASVTLPVLWLTRKSLGAFWSPLLSTPLVSPPIAEGELNPHILRPSSQKRCWPAPAARACASAWPSARCARSAGPAGSARSSYGKKRADPSPFPPNTEVHRAFGKTSFLLVGSVHFHARGCPIELNPWVGITAQCFQGIGMVLSLPWGGGEALDVRWLGISGHVSNSSR